MLDASQIQAQLRSAVLPGLDGRLASDQFVMPNYDGLGIANLPATIGALFDAELNVGCPPLNEPLWSDWRDGLKRIILVVIDALGYLQLQSAMAADDGLIFHPLAQAGRLLPITSTFLSTTNNVLTTLWTGHSPAAHGVLAYEQYLRELGVAMSPLFFWPVHHRQRDSMAEWGIDEESFVPVPSIAQQLGEHGISTRTLISRAYANSLLSRIHRRGVQDASGFVSGGDMWLEIKRKIEKHPQEKMFLTAYWDTIDGITHEYGPDDDAWKIELRSLSWMLKTAFLDRMPPRLRKGTLLLITADHGGLSTDPSDGIRLEHHPTLRDGLSLPPLGETRIPFLHVRGDARDEVRDYMLGPLSSAFITLDRETVLSSGLLGPGPVYQETPHRVGDLVGIAVGNHYLARNEHQLTLKGRHGGLSPQEMLVPLLGVRLEAL